MFPDLEFIKTILNGLRSRIEKVEKKLSAFAADATPKLSALWSNRPNWEQNDPEALDYIKGRTHYDQRVTTTVTGTILYGTTYPDVISADLWNILLTKQAVVYCSFGTYVYTYSEPNGPRILYENTERSGLLWVSDTTPVAYFSKVSDVTVERWPIVTAKVTSGQIKQLDSKFLPTPTAYTVGAIKADPAEDTDTQPARLGADGKLYTAPYELPIATASVGQVLVVKSVDENGKPTEFEAVDMPNLTATVSEEKLILGSDDSVTEE